MPSDNLKAGSRVHTARAVFLGGPWDGSSWRLPLGRPTPFLLARIDNGTRGTAPSEIGRYDLLLDEHMGRPSLDDAGRYRYSWAGMDDVGRYTIGSSGRAVPREVPSANA